MNIALSILLYGVSLNEDQAKRVYKKFLKQKDKWPVFKIPTPEDITFYRTLDQYFLDRGDVQKTPQTPYMQHDKGVALGPFDHSRVFEPTLVADGANRVIDDVHFNEGFQHILGVEIGEKGISADDLSYFFQNFPKEAAQVFERVLKPICQELGVEANPELKVINQLTD